MKNTPAQNMRNDVSFVMNGKMSMDIFLHRHHALLAQHTSYLQMALSDFLEQGAGRDLLEQMVRTEKQMHAVLEDGLFVESAIQTRNLDVWQMVVDAVQECPWPATNKWEWVQKWILSFFREEHHPIHLDMMDALLNLDIYGRPLVYWAGEHFDRRVTQQGPLTVRQPLGLVLFFLLRNQDRVAQHLLSYCQDEKECKRLGQQVLQNHDVETWENIWPLLTPLQQEAFQKATEDFSEGTLQQFPSLVKKHLTEHVRQDSKNSLGRRERKL